MNDLFSNIFMIVSVFCGIFIFAKVIVVIYKGVVNEVNNLDFSSNLKKDKENKDFEKFNSIKKEVE